MTEQITQDKGGMEDKNNTYRVRVHCTNCDYGCHGVERYEDIEKGKVVPTRMECPQCECFTLVKE